MMTLKSITILLAAIVAVSVERGDCGAGRNEPSIQVDQREALGRDKTWTTGGPENNSGSQVFAEKQLARRISLQAERTGFAPA